eukprot:8436121-Pyramimonas_sp.AAC.1
MGREENGHEVAAQGARALEGAEVVRDASAMVEALKRHWDGRCSRQLRFWARPNSGPVSYTHLRAHETGAYL